MTINVEFLRGVRQTCEIFLSHLSPSPNFHYQSNLFREINLRMNNHRIGDVSPWSREQNEAFENGLALYPDDSSDRWEKIAALVPGKEVGDMEPHYMNLVDDINAIESGLIPLPQYSDSAKPAEKSCFPEPDKQRRKGVPWSEEEHRLFLLGLEKHGKGDWKTISRNFVRSKTAEQVASHAQKFYNRLNTPTQKKKRPSIHDTVNPSEGGSTLPVRITGTIGGGCVTKGSSSQSLKQPPSVDAKDIRRTFVPPTVVHSLDALISIPPELPFPAEIVHDSRNLNPASLISSDPMNPASMDYFKPGFYDRLF